MDRKLNFIQQEMFLLLNEMDADANGKWGKMNAQQMIEHLADFFDVSTEKIQFDLVTPEEHLPKYKDFLMSDKEFRENTKAPASVLGEEPLPLRYPSMDAAKEKLRESVSDFIGYFKNDPHKRTSHPVFGMLDFNEWLQLHSKHVRHHYRQFGIL
jgi:hypothetical protein